MTSARVSPCVSLTASDVERVCVLICHVSVWLGEVSIHVFCLFSS